jgi:hypothetical protein
MVFSLGLSSRAEEGCGAMSQIARETPAVGAVERVLAQSLSLLQPGKPTCGPGASGCCKLKERQISHERLMSAEGRADRGFRDNRQLEIDF